MTIRQKAMLGLVLIAVLWGSAGVVAKLLVAKANIFVILFYRFGIASLLVFPLFLRQPKPKGYLKILIPFSLLNSLNAIFFYLGLTRTTSNAAFIINTTTPLVTTILASKIIGEYPSRKKFTGIIIGLTGALFIVLLPLITKGQSIHGDFLGNIYVFAALLCFALYTVGSRYFLSSEKYTPLLTSAVNFFTTTIACLSVALLTGKSLLLPALGDLNYFLVLLYAAILITLITFSLLQWVLKHLPASTASLKDYIQLIVGFGLNALILGEKLTLYYLVGTILVIIGVMIATGDHFVRKIILSVKSRTA